MQKTNWKRKITKNKLKTFTQSKTSHTTILSTQPPNHPTLPKAERGHRQRGGGRITTDWEGFSPERGGRRWRTPCRRGVAEANHH